MDERQEPHIDPADTPNNPVPQNGNESVTSDQSASATDNTETAQTSSSTPINHPGKDRRGLVSYVRDTWNGPRRGILILIAIGILVLIIGLIDLATDSGHKAPPPKDQAPAVPHRAGMPGGAVTAPYQQASNDQNAQQAQQAAEHGGSYIPPMGPLTPIKPITVAPKPVKVQPHHVQAAQVVRTGYTAYPDQKGMDKEIRALTKNLKPVAALTENSTAKLPGQIESATSTATAATSSTQNAAKPQPVILAEPGHISFATLDTSIKSTEPGPVMATIATGRFAGAKLLGGYVRHAGRVVVEFNEMTLHHQSYSIQAVAITTDTARTALSTYTNYHVLYRYGWLIGSALLEGVTNALQSANTTSYLSGSGVGVVTQQLSNGQIAASAIGNVGEVLAPIMEKRFETPPTVHVRAGTGVGILFMKPVEQGLAKG